MPERRSIPITAVIAVRNEAVNLPKCLEPLGELQKVVVVDSHSTDGSDEIARRFGADVVQFEYLGGYPKKRQWAIDSLSFSTEWILLLDADEVVSPQLLAEMRSAINGDGGPAAYLIRKEFHFLGRRFRYGGFSHSAVLLFRRGRARFEHLLDEPPGSLDMEVHERLLVEGTLGRLAAPLKHEDFKGLEAYLDRHNQYSTWEARLRQNYLKSGSWGHESIRPSLVGNTQQRRRWLKGLAMRTPAEPLLWFLYHLIIRGGFLEGRRGWIASRIRAQYIWQVRAKMFESALLAAHAQSSSSADRKAERASATAAQSSIVSSTRP